jgi:hypothetical protein
MKSMRYCAILAVILLMNQLAPSAERPSAAGTQHPYRQQYAKATFGPKAMLGVGAGATVQHVRNSPHEWGRGPAGFGKRIGSAFGTHVVKNSIEFGVASVRHEEMGYRRSGKQGFGPRLKYALVSTVVTRKTTTGKRTAAVGRMSGAMGSGLISRAWQPARLHTVASGVASGGMMLGVEAGTHVAREFWPQKHHPHS